MAAVGGVRGAIPRVSIRHRRLGSASAAIGALILAAVCGAAVVVALFHVGDPNGQALDETLLPPSLGHPFGTDGLGRDVFLRTVYAGWTDLRICVIATYLPLALGIAVGTVSGYLGGRIDSTVMRFVDVFLAFPFMVTVLAVVTISGPGIIGVYFALVIKSWPTYARIARGEMLTLRERQYILAAQTLGFTRRRVLLRHALPQIIRPSLVFSLSDLVLNIVALASLSFLGLGVQPPTPEWGAIIADGEQYLQTAWWVATLPGIFVVLVGLAISLCGEAVAERFNVRASVYQ